MEGVLVVEGVVPSSSALDLNREALEGPVRDLRYGGAAVTVRNETRIDLGFGSIAILRYIL